MLPLVFVNFVDGSDGSIEYFQAGQAAPAPFFEKFDEEKKEEMIGRYRLDLLLFRIPLDDVAGLVGVIDEIVVTA